LIFFVTQSLIKLEQLFERLIGMNSCWLTAVRLLFEFNGKTAVEPLFENNRTEQLLRFSEVCLFFTPSIVLDLWISANFKQYNNSGSIPLWAIQKAPNTLYWPIWVDGNKSIIGHLLFITLLKIGITLAIFNSAGTIPAAKDE